MGLDGFYAQMLRIRLFEEALLKLFSRGILRGTVHTCLGQEACAVGVAGALDPRRDTVCSNHRGHGHFLAFGGDMKGLLDEIIGRDSGICAGKGGSQHLHSKNFYSNGVLGGMVPVATGIALAQKRSDQQGISVVFAGDGAMAEGVIYEAINIAALWSLPLLLVIENNHIAQTTPEILAHASPIENIPVAFGVCTEKVDGNDVLAVRSTTDRLIEEMRVVPSPRCLVLDTCRLGPHSKSDDTRAKDEIARCHERDPLKKVEAQLPAATIANTQARCNGELQDLLAEFSLT
ncbi:thiamine pyrophosphate-dependent dehydrogenase E1 component subunit alpha [Dechloromonas sp. ZS-1]|uniref:thiamine pyrophosphate-dependent dehydrogenase E1 component subunit alpha n=1 Tax=Dechloromonas sp. ZS-1 TaxID=3138067 RepID=UPI0031FBB017